VDVSSRLGLRRRLRKLEKNNASLLEELDRLQAEAEKGLAAEEETIPAKPEASYQPVLPSTSAEPESETESESESDSSESDRDS